MNSRENSASAGDEAGLIELLPPSAQELVEVIGLPAVLRLVEAAGGTMIYIPQKPDDTSRLALAMGLTAYHIFIRHYGGAHFAVPTFAAARQKSHLIARAAGTSNEVAAKYGVTERWVRMIRQRLRSTEKDTRQIDMFE